MRMQSRGRGQVPYANQPREAGGACVPGGKWAGFSDTHACAAALRAGPEPRLGTRTRSRSGEEPERPCVMEVGGAPPYRSGRSHPVGSVQAVNMYVNEGAGLCVCICIRIRGGA